jgi:hypothetical protein
MAEKYGMKHPIFRWSIMEVQKNAIFEKNAFFCTFFDGTITSTWIRLILLVSGTLYFKQSLYKVQKMDQKK